MTGRTREDAGDIDPNIPALESLAMRRKLQFWRRVAGLLGGLIVLVLIVASQRAETSRIECADSLAVYAEMAAKNRFDNVPAELIETMWNGMSFTSARRMPNHYAVIAANWSKPVGREDTPLAICGHTHTTLLGQGRNVLFRTKNGLVTRWLSTGAAQPIYRAAGRSDDQ